jgi:hypothetical protein
VGGVVAEAVAVAVAVAVDVGAEVAVGVAVVLPSTGALGGGASLLQAARRRRRVRARFIAETLPAIVGSMRRVGVLVLVAACGCQLLKKKQDPPADAGAAPVTTSKASSQPEPEEEPKKEKKPGPSSAGKVGIKICDDFLADYACHLKKTSPQAAEATISQLQAGWVQAAAHEVARPGIEMACRSMATSSKSAMKKSGCLKATLEEDDPR